MRVIQMTLVVLPLAFARNLWPRANTITLDASTTYQKMIDFWGFGGVCTFPPIV